MKPTASTEPKIAAGFRRLLEDCDRAIEACADEIKRNGEMETHAMMLVENEAGVCLLTSTPIATLLRAELLDDGQRNAIVSKKKGAIILLVGSRRHGLAWAVIEERKPG